MQVPVTYYNSRYGVIRRSISLPNGKVIVLCSSTPEYTTSDPEEIAFLSGVSFLGSKTASDSEVHAALAKNYDNIPSIHSPVKSVEEIFEHTPFSVFENIAIERLRENGYTVEKKNQDGVHGVLDAPPPPSVSLEDQASMTKPRTPPQEDDTDNPGVDVPVPKSIRGLRNTPLTAKPIRGNKAAKGDTKK